MKFIAIRSNIKEAISIIEKASGENQNLPILKNFFIEADDSGIVVVATNLEMAIKHRISGKVIEAGKLTIPMSLFSSLINNIQGDRINFEQKENNLRITADNYNAVINGLPADDFPITPKIKDEEHFIEIKGVFLKEAIQQASSASQFSDLRPELNSILFDFSLETLKLAATDAFRLAEKSIPANFFNIKNGEPFKILVPLKTAHEVSRIVKDDAMVRIFRDENQVLFKTDETELISRLVEGSFPDYSGLIPREFAAEIAVNREDFLNAIKLAGIFGQRNSEVKIAIHENKKAIEVSSGDQSLGENNSILAAKIKGNAPETFFNWRYLADPIKGIKSEELFLGIQEEGNPALMKSTTDNSYFYIVKPILKS